MMHLLALGFLLGLVTGAFLSNRWPEIVLLATRFRNDRTVERRIGRLVKKDKK